jgi:hypothetical protein
MIGEGTGSSLDVSVAVGELDSLGLSETCGEGDEELDVLGSSAVVSSPSSEPHATAVTATSASPAMATGIRVMRQVCLLLPTKIRTAANLRGFHTVREGEA